MIRLARVSVRVLMDVPSPLVVVAEVLVLVQSLPDESSNIPALFAAEVIHAPHSVCAKDDAPLNMCFMSVTLDTSHLEMSQLNDDAEKNIPNISVTLDTSHLEMSPLKDDAELNIVLMFVTLDTSHLDMLPLNNDADNIDSMVVTLDTSHLERSPSNDDA